jgi:hypothetical protein
MRSSPFHCTPLKSTRLDSPNGCCLATSDHMEARSLGVPFEESAGGGARLGSA